MFMNNYFYGCAITDEYLFRNPDSLPRYGYLARKAMMHYLGEAYNAHRHGMPHEPFLRQMIHEFVSYKVFNRLSDYDWDWLDHSFRKYFNGCFDLNLPVDHQRIKTDLNESAKSPYQTARDTIH
jgi:hypothetical protein